MSAVDKLLQQQFPEAKQAKPNAELPPGPVLQNHPAQRAVAIDGWRAAVFGLPFLAAGIFVSLAALGVFHGHKNAPDWVIGIFGGTFFFAGLFFLVHGVLGMARKSSYLKAATERPGQPWCYDFHWRQEGVAFSAFNAMVQRLLVAVVWSSFLAPFFWIGLHSRGAWFFLVIASLFGLVALSIWYRWLQMLTDLLFYGDSYLHYDGFPYFLGSSLRARLRAPNHLTAIEELTLTLRCVQEKYVTSGTGENRSTAVVCYELYKDVLSLTRDQISGLAGGEIPIEFRLPDHQPSTALGVSPPIYWEIEARGKSHAVNYQAYFLVPVYKAS
jgi:hypothetical protein